MAKKLVIVGAGGFGREVMWQIIENSTLKEEYQILGYVDNSPDMQGKTVNGYAVVGDEKWLIEYPEEICAVICVGNSLARKALAERLQANKNISFPTIIASDVKKSDTVTFGKGCIICLSNIFTVNITCGDFVITNLDCTVGHDAVISDYVTLYPSVNVSGNTHIGECAEIGTGTNIIQGKTIGNKAIIGAGSVVVKDIPDNCTAVGAPAKPIKFNS